LVLLENSINGKYATKQSLIKDYLKKLN